MALLQVKTENGIVEGLPAGNQSVSIFKGIPFAKPPVGDLRWKAPQPAEDWDGVLLCHQFAPIPMLAPILNTISFEQIGEGIDLLTEGKVKGRLVCVYED